MQLIALERSEMFSSDNASIRTLHMQTQPIIMPATIRITSEWSS